MNPFIALAAVAVLGLLAVVVGVLRGRTAKHRHGDEIAAKHFGADLSDWDGGSS